MKMKLKALAISTALLGGLAAAPAQAFVYADSSLMISGLVITVTPGGLLPRTFSFTNTNSAVLNGAGDFHSATCGGAPGAPGVTNDCSPGVGPRLNPAAANAPGGSAAAFRGNTDFTYKGPGGGLQFSNSASSIDRSELTLDGATAIRQIAESQLIGGLSASATADIQSVSGFTFSFTLAAPGSLSLSFAANPDQFAQILEASGGLFSAQSTLAASFKLQQDTGGNQSASWAPRGTAANDCVASGTSGGSAIACTETNDSQDLNSTIGTTTNGTSAALSHGDVTFTLFGITITGLGAGNYTLTLASNSKTQLRRQVVPEPESLLLLGIGVAALGLGSRRRQKKQAA